MQDSTKNIWLRLIARAYHNICKQHSLMLKRPIFTLHKGKNILGSWDKNTRQISINQLLFKKYSWWEVEQILRHEMAHQLVDELPDICDGTSMKKIKNSHGKEFLHACKILGVEEEYSSATILDEKSIQLASTWRNKKKENQATRLLHKIEKLLALAQSANKHEAQGALEKAQELMKKKHLQRITCENVSHRCLVINMNRSNVALWQKHLCSLLQDFFMVQVIIGTTFDLQTGKELRAIELFGTPENVLVAEYCYYFVSNHLDELWKHNRKQFGAQARNHRGSYFVGVVLGFREKLVKQQKKSLRQEASFDPNSQSSLITQKRKDDEKLLVEFIHRRHPRTMQTARCTSRIIRNSFKIGRADGQELGFASGIQYNDKVQQLDQ